MERKDIIYIIGIVVLVGILCYQIYYIMGLNKEIKTLDEKVSALQTEQRKVASDILIAQEQIKNTSQERDAISAKYLELERLLQPYKNG